LPIITPSEIATLKAQIAAITPATAENPLPVPNEGGDIAEIVQEFNGALERLNYGYISLRRFIWDAAHQLRTPLAVLAARISAPSPPTMDEIQHDLEWMSRLVGQLLSAARASEAHTNVFVDTDLIALAQDVVGALAPLAIYRGRMIELIADESSTIMVKADRSFAFEAISNLVENSMGHAPEGSFISVYVTPPGLIEVADTGYGVPLEHRERIFRPFEQGPIPTKGGAGLGLSIVKEVMHQHGGTVSYRDNEGGGAVFCLNFVGV
jgi:signal transduction histidine kinase